MTLNTELSAGCLAHDHYLALNPKAWDSGPHDEQPGNPGYSDAGRNAARTSDLAPLDNWGKSDIFDQAPIHLQPLLDPTTAQLGIGNAEGHSCVGWGYLSPSLSDSNTFSTYPGSGKTDVEPSEQAYETPNPNPMLGFPADATTGPWLFVYANGPWISGGPPYGVTTQPLLISQATLTAAGGETVPVKVADRTVAAFATSLDVGSAMIVPVHPLKPQTVYTASVTATSDGVTLSHSWSFTTGGHTAPPKSPTRASQTAPKAPKLPGTLVFSHVSRGQVATVYGAKLGGPLHRLFSLPKWVTPLQISADGKRVLAEDLYHRYGGGDGEVQLMTFDGHGGDKHVVGYSGDGGPAMSPNGKWVIFAGDTPNCTNGGCMSLYLVHPDGSDSHPITRLAGFAGVSFSSDSSQILVANSRQLIRMTVSGGRIGKPIAFSSMLSSVVWTAGKITVATPPLGPPGALYTVSTASGKATKVADIPGTAQLAQVPGSSQVAVFDSNNVFPTAEVPKLASLSSWAQVPVWMRIPASAGMMTLLGWTPHALDLSAQR